MQALNPLALQPNGGAGSSRRVLLLSAAVAAELPLGYAIARSSQSSHLVLAAAIFGCLVLACIATPFGVLATLAAVWGAAHSIFADYVLGTFGGTEITLSRALGIMVTVGFGAFLVANTAARRTSLPPALKALLLFLALFAADAYITRTQDATADLVRVAGGILICLVAFYVVNTRKRLERVLALTVIGGVVTAAIAVLQFALIRAAPSAADAIFGTSFYNRVYNPGVAGTVRVHGPLGGAGETAAFLVVVAGFGLVRYTLLRDDEPRRRDVLALVVIALGVVATLTRTSIVALVVLLAVWSLQHQLRRRSRIALRVQLFTAVAAVAVIALPFIGTAALHGRLWDINPATSGGNFAQGRAAIWQQEVSILRSSGPSQLLLGHGIHSSYVPVLSIPNLLTNGDPVPLSPHNVALWLLVETGVLGTGLFVFAIASAFRDFRRASVVDRFDVGGRVGAVAVAALVAVGIQDMFVLATTSPGQGWYFMLFFGTCLRACFGFASPPK